MRITSKLRLQKETLRKLDPSSLGKAAGGNTIDSNGCTFTQETGCENSRSCDCDQCS